ncbi:hypothetical protein CTI12_AA160030 [Artemisia annua]|uniref:DUF4220 domain-containing protein n=1 Tax=Artemisia annua TaxID=35608 RepID=A0A2U1PEJ6_ARTAN|nr:hypothetical protein CTI12_AA160030 [Artemisia annua]
MSALSAISAFSVMFALSVISALSAVSALSAISALSAVSALSAISALTAVVQYAYQSFQTFKGLVVDLVFSRKEWNQSRDFLLNRTAKYAFKMVEVELNFFYEVLFTKLPVVYGYFGDLCRLFSLATVCLAIDLFTFKNKSNFRSADVTVTHYLLYSALALDMSAICMLVFSD